MQEMKNIELFFQVKKFANILPAQKIIKKYKVFYKKLIQLNLQAAALQQNINPTYEKTKSTFVLKTYQRWW